MVEGYPPQPEKYDTAPFVIGDTITPYYHPGAGMWVDSRKALADVDRATGTITTDKMQPAIQASSQAQEKELSEDRRKAILAASEAIESGQREFSEAEKAFHKQENERMSKEFGFDAFNVLGKKKNVKRRKRTTNS